VNPEAPVTVGDLKEVRFSACGSPCRMFVRPGTLDERIIYEVIHSYRMEELVARCRRQGHVTIFDVGGHIGTFSIVMATLLPNASIHVFEPIADNFALLTRNIRHAGLQHAIVAHHAAIGGSRRYLAEDAISRSPDARNTGGHAVLGGDVDIPADGRGFVEVKSLGVLVDREERVDLLKIDCEGAEYDALYSLSPAQLAKITAMVGEIHSCEGYAGMMTAGVEWNGTALKRFLRGRYRNIRTGHRVQTETSVLEIFQAE
jgi:FkbM family methyltransferase